MKRTRITALIAAACTASAAVVLLVSQPSQAEQAKGSATAQVSHGRATEKVIMDVDMGELNDDAIAMFMLAQSPNVELLGVTPVSGNTWVEEGVAYTLRQLEIVNHEKVPVVAGSGEPLMGSRQATLAAEQQLFGKTQYSGAYSGPRPPSYTQLSEPPYGGYPKTKPVANTTAADFIVDQVKRYPNQVTLFVLGPATNIALAVRTHPEIVPLVKKVIYMGGAIDIPGNTSPAAEFNWWFDPEAAKIALRTPFKEQLIVPLDVAEKVFYTKAEYDRVVGGPQTPITKMFKDLHGPRFDKNPASSSFVWDSLTAAVFLDPSIATTVVQRNVDIDTAFGADYGRSLGYTPTRAPVGTQTVNVLLDINSDKFWDLYVDRMTKPVS